MKLTDPEIIEARKRALENNPRSYEAWYETLTFGREIEKLVLEKYWQRFPNSRPVEEGWYVAATQTSEGKIFVTTLFWSNQKNIFSVQADGWDGFVEYVNPVFAFKKMQEFIDDAGLKPPSEEEGSLAHQGVEDGKNKNVSA